MLGMELVVLIFNVHRISAISYFKNQISEISACLCFVFFPHVLVGEIVSNVFVMMTSRR